VRSFDDKLSLATIWSHRAEAMRPFIRTKPSPSYSDAFATCLGMTPICCNLAQSEMLVPKTLEDWSIGARLSPDIKQQLGQAIREAKRSKQLLVALWSSFQNSQRISMSPVTSSRVPPID